MEQRTLPLEDLFYRLRDHGLPLGIDEYTAVLQALQAGIGLADRSSLRQLCLALWVKSDEDELLFKRLFDEMLARPVILEEAEPPAAPKETAGQEPAPVSEEKQPGPVPEETGTKLSPKPEPSSRNRRHPSKGKRQSPLRKSLDPR
jgi:uncharacterized protein